MAGRLPILADRLPRMTCGVDVLKVVQGVGAACRLRHDVVNVTPARDNAATDAAHAGIAGNHL